MWVWSQSVDAREHILREWPTERLLRPRVVERQRKATDSTDEREEHLLSAPQPQPVGSLPLAHNALVTSRLRRLDTSDGPTNPRTRRVEEGTSEFRYFYSVYRYPYAPSKSVKALHKGYR